MATNQIRPIDLMVKLSDDSMRGFKIISWKVRSEVMVTKNAEGLHVCDCQIYRFEGKCAHSEIAAAKCKQIAHGNDNWIASKREVDWRSAEPTEYLIIGDEKEGKGKPAQVSYEMGDLSLYDLVFAMTNDSFTEEIQKKADDKNSIMNPARIVAECEASLAAGVSIIDDVCKAAGIAIDPLKRSEVVLDDDYDEDLTASMDAKISKASEVPPPPPAGVHTSVDWKTIRRPDPKNFYVSEEIWHQMLFTMQHGGNILLTGPSGSGKSELAYIAAKGMGLPIAAFNFGAMQEPLTTLIGNTHFNKDKGTWFQKSRFVKAIESDRHAILLDELTRDRGAAAHNILLPLLDRQGYLSLDAHDESPIVRKGEHVCFIATANIGAEYTGTEALDKAMKDRMDIIIDMTWAPKQYEVKILMMRCPGLKAGDAARLTELAIEQRQLAVEEGMFTEQISTRMLISAGTRISQGMDMEQAVTFCMANHFSNEGGEASERSDFFKLMQKKGKF